MIHWYTVDRRTCRRNPEEFVGRLIIPGTQPLGNPEIPQRSVSCRHLIVHTLFQPPKSWTMLTLIIAQKSAEETGILIIPPEGTARSSKRSAKKQYFTHIDIDCSKLTHICPNLLTYKSESHKKRIAGDSRWPVAVAMRREAAMRLKSAARGAHWVWSIEDCLWLKKMLILLKSR